MELELDGYVSEWPDPDLTAFWTDDYSSIIPVVKWDSGTGWWKACRKNRLAHCERRACGYSRRSRPRVLTLPSSVNSPEAVAMRWMA